MLGYTSVKNSYEGNQSQVDLYFFIFDARSTSTFYLCVATYYSTYPLYCALDANEQVELVTDELVEVQDIKKVCKSL